jgi:hypothetical protein
MNINRETYMKIPSRNQAYNKMDAITTLTTSAFLIILAATFGYPTILMVIVVCTLVWGYYHVKEILQANNIQEAIPCYIPTIIVIPEEIPLARSAPISIPYRNYIEL